MRISSNIHVPSSDPELSFPAFAFISHSRLLHFLQDGSQCKLQWPSAAIPVSAAAESATISTDRRFSAAAGLCWTTHVPAEHCPAYKPASNAIRHVAKTTESPAAATNISNLSTSNGTCGHSSSSDQQLEPADAIRPSHAQSSSADCYQYRHKHDNYNDDKEDHEAEASLPRPKRTKRSTECT